MLDLIYAPNDVRKLLEERYPTARFEDTSNVVHRERFSIDIPDSNFDQEDYWRFLIVEGIAAVSLGVGLAIRIPGKQHSSLLALLAQMDAEKANVASPTQTRGTGSHTERGDNK